MSGADGARRVARGGGEEMISRRPEGVGERNGFQTGAAGNTEESGINVWKW